MKMEILINRRSFCVFDLCKLNTLIRHDYRLNAGCADP